MSLRTEAAKKAGETPAGSILRGPAYRQRRDRIERLRLAVQLFSLAVIVWIGVEFVLWIHTLQHGHLQGGRPPGVEGFLPISALISLRYLFQTGAWAKVHPAGLAILLLAVANGLLLKKSFCSWICPIGLISESIGSVGQKFFRRRLRLPRWADLPLRGIKYLLLAFFLVVVFVQMSPLEVERFLNSPYNKMADLKMLDFFIHVSPLALKVLVGLLISSFLIPYFWCRYLCPYGALLGGLSLLSPLKIRRDPVSCIDCGLCAKACPTLIRVDVAGSVRSDECFGCLSCVGACPVPAALQLRPPRSRRRVRPLIFALLVVGLFYGGIQAARLCHLWENGITPAEYQRRMGEIDSPKYSHARGQVPDYAPGD
jgi:polyferredoxin